ncbi:MAG: type II toxin-antitoxin system VapC family toxin [Candidatus Obscuribacterales bacterium]
MSAKFFVTDTHPLVWYLANKEKKLPKRVLSAFRAAHEGSGAYIWVPCIVAWELSELMRKTDRIRLQVPFDELIKENFFFKNLAITAVEPSDLLIGQSLTFNQDPFDRLIVATAIRLELPLITADGDITESQPCEIFWK